jgi:SAM-dependent methyltransferase
VRSSISSSDEPGLRFGTAARLALRALRSGGAAYPELAAYLAGDTARFLAAAGVPLSGARVLDLGSGHGATGHAIDRQGAIVISADRRPLGGPRQVVGDGEALPFATSSFDGAVCSNLLEHVPSTRAVLSELARVVRPGGWVYLSWTAWYGPLGGHEYSPFHYLGVRPARTIGNALRARSGRNVPGVGLFPVHVGRTIAAIRSAGQFRIRSAVPRYWPSQAWIVRIPGLREVATWNCLLLLERR